MGLEDVLDRVVASQDSWSPPIIRGCSRQCLKPVNCGKCWDFKEGDSIPRSPSVHFSILIQAPPGKFLILDHLQHKSFWF